jgi:hypothetical protein
VKAGFLILAHDEAPITRRLIARLDVPWARTFVHVDRKADIAPFAQGLERRANLTFQPQALRREVHWGGFNGALAMLDLCRLALAQEPDLDRLFFLSGVDYPVRALEDIARATAGPEEFIRIDRRLDPAARGHFNSFVRRRRFDDHPLLNERTGPAAGRLLAKLAGRVATRPNLGPIPVYHGSSSWSFTAATVRDILTVHDAAPALLTRFRHVHIPDEMIMHSAIKALPAAARVTQDFTLPGADPAAADPALFGLHYIDWSQGGSGPKILDLADLPRIAASGALFARKTSQAVSLPLLDHLDARDA